MKKILALAAVATAFSASAAFAETSQSVRAATEEAAVQLNAGQMLYSAAGYRVAPIYRVNAEGNPQVILSGKLVTVPASTITNVAGKVTTSLTKKEIASAK